MLSLEPILRVEGLSKSFKGRPALQDVSFEVQPGEIFCLLGPNGAGKSTTMNILSMALSPDRGQVYFRGTPIRRQAADYRRRLGVVPQDVAIYEEISARDNVAFFASLYGLRGPLLRKRVQWALDFVGLSDRQLDKPRTFSGGMKRRLNIACAIAHDPDVIMMDEPTVGIDPQSRAHILQRVGALRDRGATVLYTTHYMEEVEAIATRIVIVDHGRIIAEGEPEALRRSLADGRRYTVGVAAGDGLCPEGLYRVDGVRKVVVDGDRIDIATVAGVENLDKIIGTLLEQGVKIRDLTTTDANLETVFLQLTGRRLRN